MPGLGGLATFEALDVDEAVRLANHLAGDLQREAAAWAKATKARKA